MEYSFKKANQADLEQVVVLWQKLMTEHRDMDHEYFSATDEQIDSYKWDLWRYFGNDDKAVLLLCQDEAIVGYATVSVVEGSPLGSNTYNRIRFCEVGDIYIDATLRGRGIGKLMIHEIMKWAKQRSATRIELMVFSENNRARQFFKGAGFATLFEMFCLKF